MIVVKQGGWPRPGNAVA